MRSEIVLTALMTEVEGTDSAIIHERQLAQVEHED
jgi:hypothetical protein